MTGGCCPTCGRPWPGTNIYANATWRGEIMRNTPREVWDAYREDGVSYREMVEMEMSYAG